MTAPDAIKDFADDPAAERTEKRRSSFFVAVRERGLLNASLDELAKAYEEDHPGEKAKWEFYKPEMSGGTDMALNREALGYHFVDAVEIGNSQSAVAPKEGLVRRGDLVLMAAPNHIHNTLLLEDAKAALDDVKAPERAYKENLEAKTMVKTSAGETVHSNAFGSITKKEEVVEKTGESQQPVA